MSCGLFTLWADLLLGRMFPKVRELLHHQPLELPLVGVPKSPQGPSLPRAKPVLGYIPLTVCPMPLPEG